MFKIIGILLVVTAGISFGFSKAGKEQKKLEQGIALKRMLYLLQGEIRYGFTPLPEAVVVIAEKTAPEFRPFLNQIAKRLKSYREESFFAVWKEALEEQLKLQIIEPKFLEILMSMGETIGYLDKEMQEKTIDFAIEQIEDVIFQMKDQVIKNCRMYRSLGLSFGLLVVIILV